MSLTVVTGGSGHLGANLVRLLVAQGRRVRVTVRRDHPALAELPIERVVADVTQPQTLTAAFAGADTVFHLAALISIDGDRHGRVWHTNVEGVRNAARAARAAKVRRFVHASSVHAFGVYGVARVDERTPPAAPDQPVYDRSKAAGEAALREEIALGLDAVVVNPTGIIGPIDFEPSRVGRLLLDLYHRRLPALVTGGFDWVDVRDVAAALVAAETRGRTAERYLISGHWHSLEELAGMAQAVTGVAPPRLVTPAWLATIGVPFAVALSAVTKREPLVTMESLRTIRAARVMSHEKAAAELGYHPRPIALTIRDTYAWFATRGLIPPLTSPTPRAG